MSIQGEMDRIAQNVANTYAVLDALGADMPEEQNSDNLATTAGSAKPVLYSEQTLTDAQKTQARTNIGAASAAEVSQLSDQIPHNTSGLTNDSDFQTGEQVRAEIGKMTHYKFEKADSLNDVTEENVIYLIPNEESKEDNIFDEYLLVDGVPELIGSTAIDLSGYALKEELPEVPETLPNPNALTFTGAVTGTYDGSKPVSVEIPAGGGGSETEADVQLATGTIGTETTERTFTPTGVTLEMLRQYKSFVFIWKGAANTNLTNTLLQFNGSSIYTKDIARWTNAGVNYVLEWIDESKTLLIVLAYAGGNPSIIPRIGTGYVQKTSFNPVTGGLMFGARGMLIFSTTKAGVKDSDQLYIVNTGATTIDYEWEIRGLTV